MPYVLYIYQYGVTTVLMCKIFFFFFCHVHHDITDDKMNELLQTVKETKSITCGYVYIIKPKGLIHIRLKMCEQP